MDCRVQLKMAENLAEELTSHVKDSIDERETKLRREYEEKLRRLVSKVCIAGETFLQIFRANFERTYIFSANLSAGPRVRHYIQESTKCWFVAK